MRITVARRLAQIFFFVFFVWFCLVATVGTEWWQWRGWPIKWFLELDPLVALGTVLTTHSLYAGLIWALVTIALTIVFGRVFCGWICPFGTIHQFMGWLGQMGYRRKEKMEANRYRPAQAIKYYILIALLSAAAGNLVLFLVRASRQQPVVAIAVAAVAVLALLWLTLRKVITDFRRALWIGAGCSPSGWGWRRRCRPTRSSCPRCRRGCSIRFRWFTARSISPCCRWPTSRLGNGFRAAVFIPAPDSSARCFSFSCC
jgi:hypothetical protein